MKPLPNTRIKWPYVTHLIDPSAVKGLLPMMDGYDPGSLVLARVVTLGKHRELEAHDGHKLSIFGGDVFVGVLGDRYATDQFEGVARAQGTLGHIVGIGGGVGEVVSMNNKKIAPPVIRDPGRPAGADPAPPHIVRFPRPPAQ